MKDATIHHGEILKRELPVQWKSLEDKKKIAKQIDYSVDYVKKLFTTKEFRPRQIAALYLAYGIDVTKFGANENDFIASARKSTNSSTSLKIFKTKGDIKENEQEFYEDYFDILNEAIKEGKEELVIYDYFAKSLNSAVHDKAYFIKNQDIYFKNIEEHLKVHPTMKYCRIIVLPTQKELHEMEKATKVKRAIKEMFLGTFKHIWRCFVRFPSQFSLYALASPVKPYSFGYIDDLYTISEYERYDLNRRVPTPDILFVSKTIGDSKGNTQKLIDAYQEELHRVRYEGDINQPPVWKVEKIDFELGTQELILHHEGKVDKLKEKINDLEGQAKLNREDRTKLINLKRDLNFKSNELDRQKIKENFLNEYKEPLVFPPNSQSG